MFGTLADAGREHRDDLDLGGPDHLHDRRGRASRRRSTRSTAPSSSSGRRPSTPRPRCRDRRRGAPAERVATARRSLAPGAVRRASARRTTSSAAGWPPASPRSASPSPTSRPPVAAGTAGRGRRRRARRCCCRSASGRPGSRRIGPGGWRRSSSLAMADAAEEVAGLPAGTIRLKWPNDLVIEPAEAASPTGRRCPRPSRKRRRACSARPTASGRPIRGSSSGSASTPTGRRPTSRPSSPRR